MGPTSTRQQAGSRQQVQPGTAYSSRQAEGEPPHSPRPTCPPRLHRLHPQLPVDAGRIYAAITTPASPDHVGSAPCRLPGIARLRGGSGAPSSSSSYDDGSSSSRQSRYHRRQPPSYRARCSPNGVSRRVVWVASAAWGRRGALGAPAAVTPRHILRDSGRGSRCAASVRAC
jgi:hypothetical protein